MIARGFKPVAWVAAIGSAALGCYMLSLQVAAERAELAGLERRIVATKQDIRSLQTELGTRGRLQQLEQWNAEVLALSAPVADQFLDSNVMLARFDVREQGLDARAPVRMASAETAPAPSVQAPVRLASAEAGPAPNGSRPAVQPLVRRASLELVPEAPVAAPKVQRASATLPADSLLDASTLRALRAEATAERDGGARN